MNTHFAVYGTIVMFYASLLAIGLWQMKTGKPLSGFILSAAGLMGLYGSHALS